MGGRRAVVGVGSAVLLTLLVLGGVAGRPAVAQHDSLVVAVTGSSPPLSYQDSAGQPAGFNVDLTREICRRLARTCEYQSMRFPDILPAVQAGNVHLGMGNFLRTPEREAMVDFSVPVWRSRSAFIGRPGGPAAVRTAVEMAAFLDGLRVGVIENSAQERYLAGLGVPGLAIHRHQAMADALAEVRDGTADAVLLPMIMAVSYLRETTWGALAFVGPPPPEEGLGGSVHIALPKGDDGLRQAVDAALEAMVADGSFQAISERHFPFAIR